jgi:hypothetical protein
MYVVFMDANRFCGQAILLFDDSPGQTNVSNSGPGYARIDNACWGSASATHELLHMLGAVQESAPNSDSHASPGSGGHCTDGWDIMCQPEDRSVTVRQVCPPEAGWLNLDCNDDDYFSAAPAPGRYLTTHWNTANSSFLCSAPLGTPSAAATAANVEFLADGRVSAEGVPLFLTWTTTGLDPCGGTTRVYERTSFPDGSSTSKGPVIVPTIAGRAPFTSMRLVPIGSHFITTIPVDQAGFTVSWGVSPWFTLTASQETSSSISYSAGWERVGDASSYGGALKYTKTPGAEARFAFTGRDVAWVSTLGPDRGRVQIYLDGKYVQTLDLLDDPREPGQPTPLANARTTRTIVFRHHFDVTGPHELRLRVEGTPGRPRIDVDGFLVIR